MVDGPRQSCCFFSPTPSHATEFLRLIFCFFFRSCDFAFVHPLGLLVALLSGSFPPANTPIPSTSMKLGINQSNRISRRSERQKEKERPASRTQQRRPTRTTAVSPIYYHDRAVVKNIKIYLCISLPFFLNIAKRGRRLVPFSQLLRKHDNPLKKTGSSTAVRRQCF